MYDLQDPHTVAYWAAQYEAEQADRDFSEQFIAVKGMRRAEYTPADYALWSAGGYADSALRVVREMPVWDASAAPQGEHFVNRGAW